MLYSEQHWEQIGGGISVCTDSVHTFNEDSLLLAAFARAERAKHACDLGTGCGIIPLMWCRREHPMEITAVDLSERACELSRLGAERSGVQKRLHVVRCDLRTFWREVRIRYDLITMNPPYFRSDGGKRSLHLETDRARRDSMARIDEVCHSAARMMQQRGRLCICFPAERLCDALCAMRAEHLEPKRIRPVTVRSGRPARLFLIEGVLGGKPGLQMEPELITCGMDGTRSGQMEEWINGGVL